MSTQTSPRDGLMVLLAAGAVFAAIVAVAQILLGTQKALLVEGGLIETLSAVGYAICIGLMLAFWGLRATLTRWYVVAMLALFAARELDMDKRPFTEGLLKSRQYIGDTVPAGERIVSAILLLAIIATVITLLWRETGKFIATLMRRHPAAVATLAGLLFIVGTKMIDGLGRKFAPYGIELSDGLNQSLAVIEEVGDFGIPLMFAIAIYLSSTRKVETV